MKKLEVTNPFDQSIIGAVPLSNSAAVEHALEVAHSLHKTNRHGIPKSERIKILRRTSEIMRDRFSDLALLIASEGGKPLVDAKVEVNRAIEGVQLCAEHLGFNVGDEIPMGLTPPAEKKLAFTIREPIGPVLAISAFNHPLNLIVHQVAPAVAAGCPVIVKPADDTPLSCLEFVKILNEAGLPDKWAQFILCDIELAQKMVTDERIAFFTFIGSARVGWKLRSLLAPGTRVALEHGGAAPVIIGETTEINDLLPKLSKGGFYHSGQVCVSVQRVFCLNNKAEEITVKLGELAKKLVVGNAVNEATDCGPLIRNKEVDRVSSWVDEAISSGGKLICGGERYSASCYLPTVLLNPPLESLVATQEIFGPVICVFDSPDLNDAIKQSNSLATAFQASIFSNDYKEIMEAFYGFDASAVIVNDHTAFRVDWMPFAGRRQSGYGVGGIGYTLEDMTQIKMGVFGN